LRRVTESESLLAIRANLAEKNFQGIVTGFWRNAQSESGSLMDIVTVISSRAFCPFIIQVAKR
jgi:hypothetical protein